MANDNLLDSSNYPKWHYRYSENNKAKLGCWKDESAGKLFKAWYFLRPEMYELLYLDEENECPVRKSKGVSKVNLPNNCHLFSNLAKMIESHQYMYQKIKYGVNCI